MIKLILSIILTSVFTCRDGSQAVTMSEKAPSTAQTTEVIPAAERLAIYVPHLEGKKVALVVNQTSMVRNRHLLDTLLKMGVNVRLVFAPEHGIRGKADAGEVIRDDKDAATGLPVLSLYGKKKKPTPADLSDIEMVVFDIQDVGVRFYTYISTLHYVMEACAENNIPLMVLDRPNPNGHYVDGPVLDTTWRSFVGMHPVPVVYGMTIGEYARMINGEGWLKGGVKCNLQVIECKNYNHGSFYELPVRPSPNLPDMRSILLYPSTCFFEGTTLSLGRGTPKPFQYIGHPGLKAEFSFIPKPNDGAKDPPLNGKVCYGSDLSGLTIGSLRDKKAIDLSYVIDFYSKMKSAGLEYFLDNLFFDKLAGSDKLRKQILAGATETEIRKSWQPALLTFGKVRQKYLLYP